MPISVVATGGPTGSWQKVNGKWVAVEPPRKSRADPNNFDELLKFYCGNSKKKKKKKQVNEVLEVVDNSFLKQYHSHDQLVEALDKIATAHPTLARRYSIGRSVEDRELAALHISATGSVTKTRPVLVPMVKYVANIHGDEAVGRELLLGLARYLTEEYYKQDRIKQLLDTTDIHLVPSINPDGYTMETRNNHNDEDLNRNFPSWRDIDKTRLELLEDREKETTGVIRWVLDNPFVLSLSFHDGRVVVNYPWDDSPQAVEGEKALCADDGVFSELSQLYAQKHTYMWTGKCLCHSETFAKGVSNGAEWYVVDNGMQDFNYLFTNCLELTVELSCWKKPPPHMLNIEWENNLESLLVLLESVHSGVKGVVVDQDGEPVNEATVYFGCEKEVKTTCKGEFWKVLLPGKYKIFAFHSNKFASLISQVEEVTVHNGIGGGSLIVNLQMRLYYTQVFNVNTVKVGFRTDDLTYRPEVSGLFPDCAVLQAQPVREACRPMKDNNSRHIVYTIEVAAYPLPLYNFFKERWAEPIVRRPETDFENAKLQRRLKIYATDKWCGRKEDWNVKLAQPERTQA